MFKFFDFEPVESGFFIFVGQRFVDSAPHAFHDVFEKAVLFFIHTIRISLQLIADY